MERKRPWKRSVNQWVILERQEGIRAEDWVRLIPVSGPELAEVWSTGPARTGPHGQPLPRELLIDRKLAPLHDLMESNTGPELVCSERFVDALEAAGATGWSARLIPHVTPNEVAGHRLFLIETEGWTGPLLDTELRLNKSDPQTFYHRGTDNQLNGAPVPPVCFDASKGSGHSVCWSPWFDGPDLWWRALIVRGDVFLMLQERIPDLRLRVESVKMVGAPHEVRGQPGRREGAGEPPPRTPSLEETFERIAHDATRYQHELPVGAGEAELEGDFARLGIPVGEGMRRFLGRWNGARLYGGALRFYAAGPPGELIRRNEEEKEFPEYPLSAGQAVFAEMVGRHALWAIDADGIVRALGRDEIVYGPDVPFQQWLADQVADLAYAWEQDGKLPWTERMLRG